VTKKYVPATKGKCVLTDAEYAKQIYTGRRMFVMSAMDVWKEKQNKTYGKIDLDVKRKYCEEKKNEWKVMTAEEKEPFDKIARDKNVRQALMAECVTEAFRKQKAAIVCARSEVWPMRRIIGAVTKQFRIG
jgi:hypothetical protein